MSPRRSSIGITLAEKHYQRALEYGANEGMEWIILTNGLSWKIDKVGFEKPISTDLVGEINFLDIKVRNQGDLEKLYILCREGLKVESEEIQALIQTDVIKRELIDTPEAKDAVSRYEKVIRKVLKEKEKAAAKAGPNP